MRERVMKGGVQPEFLTIPEESEQPQPPHVETSQDSSMSTLYGGVIFNADGSFELTPEFLAFFGLQYNDDKNPIKIKPFQRVETSVRKQVDDSFRKLFFNKTNERRVIIDKRLKGPQEVWTLSWQHTDTTSNTPSDSKQRYLVTTTDSHGFVTNTTNTRIVKLNAGKLALYVTTAENEERLNFQCDDTVTYPKLYFENGEPIDTEVYSELIQWNDDKTTDTCFKSLRIFSMFIILLTIVNAKETDMNYKVENPITRSVETKNFKTDCPFVLTPLSKRIADAAERRANAPKSIEERREEASDEISQAIQEQTDLSMSWRESDRIKEGIIRRICHKYNLDHDSECNRKLWHGWFK